MSQHTQLLTEAAALFRYYEASHRAKGTEDSTKKAERNAEIAGRIEAALAAPVGDTGAPESRDFGIWWTTMSEAQQLHRHGPLPDWMPKYIADLFLSRVSCEARGRVWSAEGMPRHETARPDNVATRCAAVSSGIVMRADDVRLLKTHYMPGFFTTLAMDGWDDNGRMTSAESRMRPLHWTQVAEVASQHNMNGDDLITAVEILGLRVEREPLKHKPVQLYEGAPTHYGNGEPVECSNTCPICHPRGVAEAALRTAFEAYRASCGAPRHALATNSNGDYLIPRVDQQWREWQAAAQSLRGSGLPRPNVGEIENA